MVRCNKCALVVANAVWQSDANQDLNDAFFGDNYKPVRSFWVQLFEKVKNRRTLKRLRPGGDRARGKLLEVGVGTGSLLSAAKVRGYSPVGCDLSAVVCSRVEERCGIAMHCGPLESLPASEVFDVVVMNHVLEHVSEPVALLQAARKRLKRGGLLHLAVPNVASWEARLAGWNSYEPYHLLYFTPETLQIAVEKAGLKVQRLTTHESFSGWFLAAVRMVLQRRLSAVSLDSRVTTTRSNAPAEHAYRLAMVVSGVLTLPLRRLQESLGKGDEVIIIAGNAITD